MTLLHSRSFGTLSGLMESSSTSRLRPRTPDKPLPLPPSTPEPLPEELEEQEDEPEDYSPTPSLLPQASPPASKRIHALMELLSTERAYASDLALIRDIHIPLALGVSPSIRLGFFV